MTHKRHSSSSRINLKPTAIEPRTEIAEAAVVEEDALSDNSDTVAANKIVQTQRKNFLCKNLYEQCKELCYN